jgi:hypothetical protein
LEDFTQSEAYREFFGLGEERGREQGLKTGELEITMRLLQRRCGGLTPSQAELASALCRCLSWKHWIRDTQLHEDAHRYRGNGAGIMGSLRTEALNLLRQAGFQSIRSGMQSVMHDIGQLVAMARRQPCLQAN